MRGIWFWLDMHDAPNTQRRKELMASWLQSASATRHWSSQAPHWHGPTTHFVTFKPTGKWRIRNGAGSLLSQVSFILTSSLLSPASFSFLFILSSTYILLVSPCLNVLGLLQCLVLQERYLQEAWTAQRCWDPQINKLLSGQLPEILKNMHNLFPVWSIFFRCQATPLSQA